MIETTGPALVLTAKDCAALVERRDPAIAAAISRLAGEYAAEAGWRAELVPAADVAGALGVSPMALRHRLRRGTWPGQQVDGRWYAVPPSSPMAPPSRR